MKIKEETIDKQKEKRQKLADNLKANLQRRKQQQSKNSEQSKKNKKK